MTAVEELARRLETQEAAVVYPAMANILRGMAADWEARMSAAGPLIPGGGSPEEQLARVVGEVIADLTTLASVVRRVARDVATQQGLQP